LKIVVARESFEEPFHTSAEEDASGTVGFAELLGEFSNRFAFEMERSTKAAN